MWDKIEIENIRVDLAAKRTTIKIVPGGPKRTSLEDKRKADWNFDDNSQPEGWGRRKTARREVKKLLVSSNVAVN